MAIYLHCNTAIFSLCNKWVISGSTGAISAQGPAGFTGATFSTELSRLPDPTGPFGPTRLTGPISPVNLAELASTGELYHRKDNRHGCQIKKSKRQISLSMFDILWSFAST